MKKVLFSILFAGIATYANAQKAEIDEAKRLWGIYQITLAQDPNQEKPKTPQNVMDDAFMNGSRSGSSARGPRGGGRMQSSGGSSAQRPRLSFNEKQMTNLKEGFAHAEKASLHDKTKDKPEAWAYKALFASTIAFVDSLDAGNSAKYMKEAEDAIAKTEALDTKGVFKDDMLTAKLNVRNTLVVKGLSFYNTKDYNNAYDAFSEVVKRNPSDTSMYMNLGVIAKLAGKYTESITNFKKLIGFNVPEAKDYYIEMINIASDNMKDTTTALNLVKEANTKFPDDAQLISIETDIYINRGDIENSQNFLSKLIAKDPNKAVYHFLMGDTYYKQALKIQDERNKLDTKKSQKEVDALTIKMTGLIDKALPLYKKAIELDPKFVPALEMLKQIYAFKNDSENYTDIKKRLDAIPQDQN